jgi:hypothetical protein
MQRPTGVTILAVLAFVGAAFQALFALGLLVLGGVWMAHMGPTGPFAMLGGVGAALVAIFFIVLAVVDGVIGSGLLHLKNWARVVTIVLAGLAAVFNGLALLRMMMFMRAFFMFNHAVATGIAVWIVVYLLQPPIKQAFGATTGL